MKRPEKYITSNKKYITNIVNQLDGEFTVKTLLEQSKKDNQSIGLTSIYRIIDQLVSENLIFKTKNSENVVSFIKCCESDSKNHFLLKCSSCKNVEHVVCDSVDKMGEHLFIEHGFNIDKKNILISGICENCDRKRV